MSCSTLERFCESCGGRAEHADRRVHGPSCATAEARDWWLEHRDKAPWAFDEDIDGLFALLEERPELIGRPVESVPDVRRVFLRRVRYFVYFEIVDDGDRVEILAIWHGSRGSGPDL